MKRTKVKLFKSSLMSDTFSRNMTYTYYHNGIPLTVQESRKLKNKGYIGVPLDLSQGMVELVSPDDARAD